MFGKCIDCTTIPSVFLLTLVVAWGDILSIDLHLFDGKEVII